MSEYAEEGGRNADDVEPVAFWPATTLLFLVSVSFIKEIPRQGDVQSIWIFPLAAMEAMEATDVSRAAEEKDASS